MFGFQCETNGAMAEYMIFPERAKVHKVPENVIAKHAAFVEPLACSIHGVELGNIQFNSSTQAACLAVMFLGTL